MPDQDVRLQLLQSWLEDCLPALFARQGWGPVPAATLAPASSDASFRRYFRWQAEGRSLILMDAPPPQEDCRPFVKVAAMLAEAGVHVPRILAQDLQRGFLVLDDLGRHGEGRAAWLAAAELARNGAERDFFTDRAARFLAGPPRQAQT